MKVFIFESTRAVIKSEKAVRAAGVECTIIPVPRSVSPLCGMAIQLDDRDENKTARLLAGLGVEIKIFDRGEIVL